MVKKSSALSQQEGRHRVKSNDMTLTDKMRKELEQIKASQSQLSSESSEETTDVWDQAEVGKFYRPLKKQITIRIDADVLEWFKTATNRYQTLINLACREYMHHHFKAYRKIKRR